MPEAIEREQKVTLYDLSATLMEALENMAEAEREADENGETVSAEQNEAFLRVIEGEMRGKTDRMCQFIHHMESQIKLADDELKRLTARKKSFESNINRLADYAHRILTTILHADHLDGETSSIRLRKLPDSVQILSRASVPAEYQETLPPEIKVNMLAIKAAMKAGKQVAGAVLITDRTKAEFK